MSGNFKRGGRGSSRGGGGRGNFTLPIHSERGGGRGGRGRGRGGPRPVEVYSANASVPVDPKATQIETQTEKAIEKSKVLRAQMPLRPGYGTQGRRVELWANHLHLIPKGDLLLHRYSVDISLDEGGRRPAGKKLRRLVQLLLEEHFAKYAQQIATDFKSNLISQQKLQLDDSGYHVRYRSEDEDEPADNAPSYRLRVQATGTLTVAQLIDYLSSSNVGTILNSKEEIIQALNIVLGHTVRASPDVTSIGSSKHYPLANTTSERFDLGTGLIAVRGFLMSVRAATSKLLVNVQVKHAAFYQEGPLEQLMQTYMHANPGKVMLAGFVKKLVVNVTHIVRRNRAGQAIPRVKVICGLAMREDGRSQPHPPIVPSFGADANEVKFFLDGGNQSNDPPPGGKGKQKGKNPPNAGPNPPGQGAYISVYDFFRRTYNIQLRHPELPVVNVGSQDNPMYLPAEVCVVRPGQAAKAKLSSKQTQNMITFAVRRPVDNAQSIVTSGVRMLGFNSANPTLNTFGINVNPALITVPGRVLNSPEVRYRNNKSIHTKFGNWNMAGTQFATKSELSSWTWLHLFFSGSELGWKNEAGFKASLEAFTGILKQSGIVTAPVREGLRVGLDPNDPAKAETTIDEVIARFGGGQYQKPPKLLLVVLPDATTSVYNRVKYACDVKHGLLNVCVIANKFAENKTPYFANVALKFNLKLGGSNQSLDNSKLGLLSQRRTMVVGADVTHPSPDSAGNAPSVAGIVASIDHQMAQWPAALRIQPQARQEMIGGLDELFKSRLRLWAKHNKNTYPENILMYRDGVSEGQYGLVLDEELPLLRKACKEMYPASDTKKDLPRITIVIVGKRHNTRFYPTTVANADRSSNPQNGTVVDRGVTEARNWDFFLQAHSAVQGTARPAHYYIIHDEIFQKTKVPVPFNNVADVMENLTHNLCYLFGRATKAVSVCPPAYYADLVCERARCYLSKAYNGTTAGSTTGSVATAAADVDSDMVEVHENVKDTMFYI
ncbi:RNA interference and gene silencing protein [Paecilomyces variotii No. 5]|uniref:RNA interference and gene silencing protein n=1 Tax=Byssochlamys spectabilis (strain No. 5 / NBRC 109023) TaxID=1356009 RepID=V5GAJ8_BYSSN|nr:RNA interference and gene silencing protein [Paecilomyces variotii No. 5]